MLMFGRPKRPLGQATAPFTAQSPVVVQNPSPPCQAEQAYDTSLPPRYSRIDYPENLPFAASSRHDIPLYAPAPVPQCPPRLPQRPLAIEPRAQSSIDSSDLSARFNNGLQITSRDVVRPHQTPHDFGNNDSALCDLIISKLNAVITSIDGETFSGDERELHVYNSPQLRGGWGSREMSRGVNNTVSSALLSTNYFRKAYLYANSRLPPDLPPLSLSLASYPLICLAAQYSQRVYIKPTAAERETHIDADTRMGTKAMVIKSMHIKDLNCIVFAIRGSQTFTDWTVNLKSTPASPAGFLDDPGNYVHSGFLSVARKMINPVAARLKSLLQEDESCANCSLVMTGHSAGGAVASLLYAHMLAKDVKSELNTLTDFFKRVHCVTFGSPPISFLPINKPSSPSHRKSLFLSFINEGDPVPRADSAYIRSLIKLYASPSPIRATSSNTLPCTQRIPALRPCKRKRPRRPRHMGSSSGPSSTALAHTSSRAPSPPPVWQVPPGPLCNAGELVVLRIPSEAIGVGSQNPDNAKEADDVRAEITCDAELRTVVFGDPMMHMMKIYARRVEVLATKAVTAKNWV